MTHFAQLSDPPHLSGQKDHRPRLIDPKLDGAVGPHGLAVCGVCGEEVPARWGKEAREVANPKKLGATKKIRDDVPAVVGEDEIRALTGAKS